jgi:transposase
MRASAKRYSDDFRTDALSLISRGDRSFRRLSDDLGVSVWTLREWWKKDQMAKKRPKKPSTPTTPGPTRTPEEELAKLQRENERLRKENDSLRMDREILKKAAAFFAKESE